MINMILSYALDIFYILAAVFVVIFFTAKGFVACISRFGRYIGAAILTYVFGPILSGFLYEKWIFPWIFRPVTERIAKFLHNTMGAIDMDGLVDSLPLLVRKFANADALMEKYGAAVDNIDSFSSELSGMVSAPPASLLSNLLAYVAVFLVSVLLLSVLFFLLEKLFCGIPALNAVNRFFGFLLGLLAAFLVLAVITWLLGVLISLFASGGHLAALAERSYIFGYFKELNFFNLFH